MINVRDQILRVPGHRAGRPLRRRRLRHAHLASPRPAGQAGPDAGRRHLRDQGAEPPGARAAQIGAAPSPKDQEFTYTVSAPGRLRHARGVREHHRPAERDAAPWSGSRTWAASSSARRTTTRSDGSTASRPARWPIYLLPGANQLQAARARSTRRWRSSRRLSPRTWTTRSSTTRRRPSRRRSRRSSRPSSRRSFSSRSSCSSSCRAGARR